MPRDWVTLERLEPDDDGAPGVLVNGEPRARDENERRAERRDRKWRERGYVR